MPPLQQLLDPLRGAPRQRQRRAARPGGGPAHGGGQHGGAEHLPAHAASTVYRPPPRPGAMPPAAPAPRRGLVPSLANGKVGLGLAGLPSAVVAARSKRREAPSRAEQSGGATVSGNSLL